MKKIIIFTEEFNLQEVCVKDQKDEKDRKREVQVERNIVLLMFSTVFLWRHGCHGNKYS